MSKEFPYDPAMTGGVKLGPPDRPGTLEQVAEVGERIARALETLNDRLEPDLLRGAMRSAERLTARLDELSDQRGFEPEQAWPTVEPDRIHEAPDRELGPLEDAPGREGEGVTLTGEELLTVAPPEEPSENPDRMEEEGDAPTTAREWLQASYDAMDRGDLDTAAAFLAIAQAMTEDRSAPPPTPETEGEPSAETVQPIRPPDPPRRRRRFGR
jgi:hypothetical protein